MGIDVLSNVLTMVRLTGALIFRVDFRGPWGIAGHPTPQKLGPALAIGTNEVIAFHVVLEGTCWCRHAGSGWTALTAGHALVITHGSPHELADQPDRATLPLLAMLGGRKLAELRHERVGSGMGSASLLCGFLGCDRRAFDPLCEALPNVFQVDMGARAEALLDYAKHHALDDQPGAAGLRVRLAELLFTEAVRLHMNDLPADATGWLAGLRDPLVGSALRALHENPGRHWSVDALATVVASSRSSLATRFHDLTGEAPMHYLARLRMQLAARFLCETGNSIDYIGQQVGYDSSAAFQRAFKRQFDLSPAAWRKQSLAAAKMRSDEWRVTRP